VFDARGISSNRKPGAVHRQNAQRQRLVAKITSSIDLISCVKTKERKR
jgi:hypothetical protein